MEKVLVDELVKEVRVTLDENQVESEYLQSSTENMELNEIIRSKMPDAVRGIVEMCPVSLLNADALTLADDDRTENEDGIGFVVLPNDFLRLVSFKLASWNRSVTSVADEESPTGLMQRNAFTRGTPMKPVCVLSHKADGRRVLEYFTASGGNDTVERALYVPNPSIVTEDGNEKISIPHLLRASIVNYCAGLACLSRGDAEQGDLFIKIATSNFNPT